RAGPLFLAGRRIAAVLVEVPHRDVEIQSERHPLRPLLITVGPAPESGRRTPSCIPPHRGAVVHELIEFDRAVERAIEHTVDLRGEEVARPFEAPDVHDVPGVHPLDRADPGITQLGAEPDPDILARSGDLAP